MSAIFGGGPGYIRLKKLYNSIFPGKSSIIYLSRDEFTTPQAAPVTSLRTCEPGPGTLTMVQNDGQFSIPSPSQLAFPIQATPAWGDQRAIITGGLARVTGYAFLWRINLSTSAQTITGWSNTASPTTFPVVGIYSVAGSWRPLESSGSSVIIGITASINIDYDFALVLRSAGLASYLRIAGVWNLIWKTKDSNVTPMYPSFNNFDSAGALKYWRDRGLGGTFATDLGNATLNVASPVDSTLYTGDANGIIDLTIANVTALSICGFKYRYLNATNYWYIYIDAAGHLKVDSVVAGTPTNQVDVAGVAAIGNTLTLRVSVHDTKHNFYTTPDGISFTKRDGEIDIGATAMDAATAVVPVIGANWTPTNLVSEPRRSQFYNQLSAI